MPTVLVSTDHTAPGAMLIWVTCTTAWGHADVQSGMLLKTMSGSAIQLQLASVLKSVIHVATRNFVESYSMNYNL